jgi:hypothetical protein
MTAEQTAIWDASTRATVSEKLVPKVHVGNWRKGVNIHGTWQGERVAVLAAACAKPESIAPLLKILPDAAMEKVKMTRFNSLQLALQAETERCARSARVAKKDLDAYDNETLPSLSRGANVCGELAYALGRCCVAQRINGLYGEAMATRRPNGYFPPTAAAPDTPEDDGGEGEELRGETSGNTETPPPSEVVVSSESQQVILPSRASTTNLSSHVHKPQGPLVTPPPPK